MWSILIYSFNSLHSYPCSVILSKEVTFLFYVKLAGSYDVVVNCTGMGARWLCNDESVEPVRGQVIRVSI